jgi:hypothetical protein
MILSVRTATGAESIRRRKALFFQQVTKPDGTYALAELMEELCATTKFRIAGITRARVYLTKMKALIKRFAKPSSTKSIPSPYGPNRLYVRSSQ